MARRKRFPDVTHVREDSPGRIPEDYKKRHRQRKSRAEEDSNDAWLAFAKAGYFMTIHNDGHHWIITSGRETWEWWPSSAKLVRNKAWKKGYHVHSWQKVLETIIGYRRNARRSKRSGGNDA